ncbi:hypothetical protein BDR26DRAFT_858570 [Obelidium mucronatum]|nr:hypothetical protein BDR26DRAFT_858570 [Obelidium mucronatum]
MRQERVRRERHQEYVKALEERDLKQDEIKDAMSKTTRLFNILVNAFDDDSFNDRSNRGGTSSSSTVLSHKEIVQAYGLGTTAYSLEIEIPSNPTAALLSLVSESVDNKVLFDELRESRKLLARFLGLIQGWVRTVSLEEIEEQAVVNSQLKRLLDLKNQIESLKSKADVLLSHASTSSNDNDDNEDNDDFNDEVFEEIPNDEEPAIPASFMAAVISNTNKQSNLDDDTSTFMKSSSSSGSTSTTTPAGSFSASSSTSRSKTPANRVHLPRESTIEDLLKAAPVVDFDTDLYYWDKKEIPFNTTGIDFHHRFLGDGRGENMIPEHIMEDLRKRTVIVEPEHVEIPPCRARLRNGKLCPRRDMVKCPFHGVVVPRWVFP